jgi:hypothetical protein
MTPYQDHLQEPPFLIQLKNPKLQITMQSTHRVLWWVTLHMQKMAVDSQVAVKLQGWQMQQSYQNLSLQALLCHVP